jgi:hypothetical protein
VEPSEPVRDVNGKGTWQNIFKCCQAVTQALEYEIVLLHIILSIRNYRKIFCKYIQLLYTTRQAMYV